MHASLVSHLQNENFRIVWFTTELFPPTCPLFTFILLGPTLENEWMNKLMPPQAVKHLQLFVGWLVFCSHLGNYIEVHSDFLKHLKNTQIKDVDCFTQYCLQGDSLFFLSFFLLLLPVNYCVGGILWKDLLNYVKYSSAHFSIWIKTVSHFRRSICRRNFNWLGELSFKNKVK